MESAVKAILTCMMLAPTAIDMWLAVIAICIAFGKKIPTLVWVMLVLEVLCVLDNWSNIKAIEEVWKAL